MKTDLPPAVALKDTTPADEGDDQYDNFGNYIGDKSMTFTIIVVSLFQIAIQGYKK